jgi:hypothetical protein
MDCLVAASGQTAQISGTNGVAHDYDADNFKLSICTSTCLDVLLLLFTEKGARTGHEIKIISAVAVNIIR